MTEKAEEDWRERVRFRKRARSILSALLIVFSLSTLFGGWFRSIRSSNSLDDLYYATIDSNAYDALLNGFCSPDVLASAVSTVKEQNICVMPSVDVANKAKFSHGTPEVPLGISSGLTYAYSAEAAKRAGVKSITWSAWNGWKTDSLNCRELSFCVGFQASHYGSDAKGTAFISVRYNVNKKVLRCRPYESIRFFDNQDYSKGMFLSTDEYVRLHNMQVEKMADEAISIIQDVILPEFANRRGAISKHSPDFEQDGVVVDIDLSREDDG